MAFALAQSALKMGRVAVAIAAMALLVTGSKLSYAHDLAGASYVQRGSGVSAGTVTMLRLQIPFGGETPIRSRATLGFSIGPSWRDAPGPLVLMGYRFVPSAEAALTLNGDPVVKLGSFELRGSVERHGLSEAQGEETFCGRNLALCIMGGVAIVVGIVGIVSITDEKAIRDCEYAAGCPT